VRLASLGLWLATAGCALGVAGCTASGDPSFGGAVSEELLGMLLTLALVVAIGIGAALALLALAACLLAASSVLIAWNLIRPHWLARILGLLTGALDTVAGASVLAILVWLAVDTHDGHLRIDLGGGGVLGTMGLLLLALGPATMIAALVPVRREPAAPPGVTPPPLAP
jgi:hypothetical protein